MPYFETSAATGTNVNDMFNKTIELVYQQKIKPQIKLEKESGVVAQPNIVIGQPTQKPAP